LIYEDIAKDCAKGWYDEIEDYDFKQGKSSNGKVVGHFTQLVWNSSNIVGYGLSTNENSGWYKVYCVANYHPDGNFRNQYTENVFPK
jgi:hypothetical protein